MMLSGAELQDGALRFVVHVKVCHLFHSLQNLEVNMAVNNLLVEEGNSEHMKATSNPFLGLSSSGTCVHAHSIYTDHTCTGTCNTKTWLHGPH